MKGASLTHHLVLWFVVVALLPLLLFGYLSLRQNETALRIEAQARMSRLADKKTMEIKVYLAERAQDAQMLAHGLLAEQAMSGLSRAYLQYRPGSAGYQRADKQFRSHFSVYIDESTLFYDVFLITPQGEIIYTDKHEADFATNLLDGPYRDSQLAKAFRESRMTLESSVSDFETYAPSNAFAAFIAAPIIHNGAFRGVIAFQLNTENIYRVAMDHSGLGVTGETVLAKLTGAGEAMFVAPLMHDPQAAMQRKIDLKTTAVPMRYALAGKRGSGMGIDYAGKQVVAAWRYLPALRWGMVVKMDADEVFAPLYQQQKILLEILLALMLLAGVVAFYFGRRLVVPLRSFALIAGKIAQGDLDKRVDESRVDEIGALGRAFNRMAENLQSLYRSLEGRVEERTHELNVANEQLQEEITERKQAALELARTYAENKWLQRFINITPDIVYFIDLEGRLRNWNTALEKFCGLSPDKMKGRPCVEFVCDQDKSVVVADVQKVFAKGSHANIYRFIRSDGALIPFHCNGTVTFNENGDPDGFAGLGRDISERERADNLIREENNFRKELINSLPGIFYMLDASGQFLMWNRNLESVLHCSAEEIAHSHPLDFFEGNDIELIRENIRNAFEVGDTCVESVLLAKNGAKIPYYFTGRRIERNGEPVVVGLGIDITERKHVEEALHRSETKFHTLYDSTSDAVMLLDEKGFFDCNKATLAIFGCATREEFCSKHPADLSPPVQPCGTDSLTLANRRIATAMEQGSLQFEWVHQRANTGKVFPADVLLNSMELDGRTVLQATVRDITDRKQAEEQLRIAAATFDVHDAILITDANANIIRVNQAFQDITGYSQEEVLGKNPRILSSDRQDKAFYVEMWQQLLNTSSWAGEIWDRRKDGQTYPKWLTITAVKNEQGGTTGYVSIFSDITARKQAEEEIRNLAFYDALTKLPNRRMLLDRFRLALSVSARSLHYGAVLFLDMDRFKTLNDTLGHDYGDLMLIEVAKRIQACVREVDTVARLGGDEFVVLLKEVDTNAEQTSQRVALIAEKIRAALAVPYQIKEHEYHSSPSIGMCLYRGNEKSVDTLLKHADLAMYQAKDSGRNAVRFFDPAMQHAVEMHAALEADLRRAVPNRELRLYYQIQVDSEHRPLGAEALVRWVHPKRGMVSPVQFIPVAEESSLILDIGNWVLDTACRQLALWSKNEQTRDLVLAVNVSAQQFHLHDFVDRIAAMVRAHQVIPARLKLELTEGVVLADVSDVVAKMHALKALGIKLSLDDFGTGYSSLSYLKQLPLDQLKIDQSFVRDIATDPNDAVMVQTIIDLAQNFRLNVIAEGVENEAQLDFLKQNGCMAYQGYLFSKPVPVEEFEALL